MWNDLNLHQLRPYTWLSNTIPAARAWSQLVGSPNAVITLMPHHHWPPPILSQQQMDVWVEVPLQGWCKLANVRHDTTHKFQFTGKQPLKSQHFKIFRPSAKGKVMFGVSDRLWYRLGGLGARRVTFRGYSMSATHSQPPSTLSSISATCGLRPKYANLLKTLGIWI